MRRRLLPPLAIASLACCVGMCVLWVRSYWANDTWEIASPEGRYTTLYSSQGILRASWGAGASAGEWEYGHFTVVIGGGDVPLLVDWEGDAIRVAYRLPVLLASIAPVLWLWRRRKPKGGTGFPVEVGAEVEDKGR